MLASGVWYINESNSRGQRVDEERQKCESCRPETGTKDASKTHCRKTSDIEAIGGKAADHTGGGHRRDRNKSGGARSNRQDGVGAPEDQDAEKRDAEKSDRDDREAGEDDRRGRPRLGGLSRRGQRRPGLHCGKPWQGMEKLSTRGGT